MVLPQPPARFGLAARSVRRHTGQPSQPCAQLGRRTGLPAGAQQLPPDGNAHTGKLRQRVERVFIGHIVAEENRAAAGERRMRHDPAKAGAFVEAGGLHLDDEFAVQDSDVFAELQNVLFDQAGDLGLALRCEPVVDRQRVDLILEADARIEPGNLGERGLLRRGQAARRGAGRRPSDRGAPQRRARRRR